MGILGIVAKGVGLAAISAVTGPGGALAIAAAYKVAKAANDDNPDNTPRHIASLGASFLGADVDVDVDADKD